VSRNHNQRQELELTWRFVELPTKAFHRFAQRIRYYESDVELCDLLVESFLKGPNTETNIAENLGGSGGTHSVLNSRDNTRASRNTCGNHLRATMATAYIKDLYEDFSEFIADTMAKAAMKGVNPAKFIGDVNINVQARDILATSSWEGTVNLISSEIFRKLENERSTKDLVKKASMRLGLQIDSGLLDAAMPYFDTRHILVHRDGKTDQKFRDDHPAIRLKASKIIVDLALAKSAKTAVADLAFDIDAKIISADLVRPQDISGNAA
jgi:hypothetical protein